MELEKSSRAARCATNFIKSQATKLITRGLVFAKGQPPIQA